MMMLNQHGDGSKPFAAMPKRVDTGEPVPTDRRSNGRPLALGAPLSASFMGLLLLRGDAAAGEIGDEPAAGSSHGHDATFAGAGGDTSTGSLSLAAMGLGISSAAAATLVGGGDVIDATALTALSEASAVEAEALDRVAGTQPVGDGAAPESVPPVPPDIGDVAIAFGSEAPFELPTYGTGEPDSLEENLGDLGDPLMIDRAPIYAEGENTAGVGGDGGSSTGQTGGPDEAVIGLRITGTSGSDYLVGTDGNDVIDAVDGKNTVLAGAGDDHVIGGLGNDILHGGPGNDTIEGRAGRNTIYGDEGDDRLFGGTGNDTIYGGSGNDRLDGVAGVNRLEGGTGDDTLVINDPLDTIIETSAGANGGGNDTLEVASGFGAALRGRFATLAPDGTATFVMGDEPGRTFPAEVNAYLKQVDPDIENVRLTGSDAHDVIGDGKANVITGNDGDNVLYGGDGDDILYAGGGNDVLRGGAGADTLHAGAGHDVLFGDAGDDVLYGGEGDSELHGGEGDDVYAFGLAEGGRATIFDHEGVNRLRFDGLDDPAALGARLEGEDLVLDHQGAEVVRIADYANHRDAFAGVEIGAETVPFDHFLEATAAGAPVAPAGDDLLGHYLGPQSVEADGDILDPARLGEDGPAHDAPFALYEDGASSSFAASPAADELGGAGADDMIGSFMRAEPLWIGPEEGVFMPDAEDLRGVAGDETQHARG